MMNINATMALENIDTINAVIEELMLDGIETEFPTKDRSVSRKHSASRRKAKEQNRNRKATAYQRSDDLYNAGLDRSGRTFKARRLTAYADLDERILEMENNKAIPSDTRCTTIWSDGIFKDCHSVNDVQRQVNCLASKGIRIDESLIDVAIGRATVEDEKREKKRKIYAERPFIGWALVSCGEINGIYPDEATANAVRNGIIEDGMYFGAPDVMPIYGFNAAQVKELQSLGFQPLGAL